MIERIKYLEEKLANDSASLSDAYEYANFAELPQFKVWNFSFIDVALWAIVSDLSTKRPTGKKIKTYTEFTDKDIESIFYPVCSKDHLRQAMQGVFFDKNFIVSTDGHILLCCADKSKIKRSGNYRFNRIAKEVTTDLLIKTDQKFPDYLKIFPQQKPTQQREINLIDFYAFLNQFTKWIKIARKQGVDVLNYYASVMIFDGLYNIEFLIKVIKALLHVGETVIRFQFWEPHHVSVIDGINNIALIMPLHQTGGITCPIRY